MLATVSGDEFLSPSEFNGLVGAHLAERYPGERGILKSAFEKGVSVFTPAFVDSEVGNDVFTENLVREREGRPRIIFDLEHDSRRLIDMMCAAEKLGIISIGGGVPRNNMQNGAPLIEIANERLGQEMFRPRVYSSGCRIAPDPMWYGHLSGCTYSENKSWRKMDPEGRFSEVHADATIVLPFLAAYLLGRQN